jgi:adenylosuccinate synthase
MPGTVIVGTQWGDEGKGKIVDIFTQKSDAVVRFQGGNNAGHTLVVKGKQTVLHLIPSGVLHKGVYCVIANGVVIDPAVFEEEVKGLQREGYLKDKQRLLISDRAHVILPYHRYIDQLREKQRGSKKIGTTGRGIGPAYEDKVVRTGIRMGEYIHTPTFKKRLGQVLPLKNKIIKTVLGGETIKSSLILAEQKRFARILRPYVCDTSVQIDAWRKKKKRILFEGAQGTSLDVDHGTYPYVTSSNTVAANACVGSGVGPGVIQEVIGIAKAYTTRVGEGPFPSELKDAIGKKLQTDGGEFGATTGRPRRCGWLDLVLLRHAIRVNGLTGIALTKLDVLSGYKTIKVCTQYDVGATSRSPVREIPADLSVLNKCKPIYKDYPGWDEDISKARSFRALPRNAQNYIRALEKDFGIPVVMISVGPGREATFFLKKL